MKNIFSHISLAKLCGWFGITRQAYYQNTWAGMSTAFEEDLILQEVKNIRKNHRRIGTRKLYEMMKPYLLEHKIKMGRDGLFGVLSANQLLIRKRKRRIQTTNSFHWLRKYPNLIRGLVPTAINQLWVSDITYWKLKNNHVYISFVTDAYSHKIVGYHVADTLEASASIRALQMALSALGAESHLQLTHHSDRGIQYCSTAYVKLLQDNNIKISMTESGDPLENAIAERINGIIKDEYLEGYDIENIKDAKGQQNRMVHKLFKNKTEAYFTFQIADKSELNTLTRIISIDDVKDLQVWAVANEKEFRKFIALNYNYTILPNPNSNFHSQNRSLNNPLLGAQLTAYPTYQQYETMMANFATTYPSTCKLVLIGTLPSGHRLLALKISSNVNVHQDKPQFLYTSTMHADETAGYIGMLNLADYLLSNYGTNTRLTSLVNNIEIWINPLANPDGCYKAGDNTVNGAQRYNANNVDLNRNYPDPQAGQHPDGNVWQPETVAFMHFADSLNLTMSANFHGGSEVVNYPWDTWTRLHADNNWWVREGAKYADTAQANAAPGYFTSVNPNGITDGYAWYQVTGGRQDYMNYFKHCREVTIELSNTKLIPTTDFTNKWNANVKSYLNYMNECLHGFRGIVTDSCSGLPLKAKVFIAGHDVDSSHVYSTSSVGDYHRPIYQGTYSVNYSASGYVSKTINNVVVTDMNSTRVDVQLRPVTFPIVSSAINSIDTTICQGTNAVFNASVTNGGTSPTYQWQVNGGTVGTNSSQFSSTTLATGSVVTCHVTSSNGCVTNNPATSNTINVVVHPLPTTPSITQTSSVLNSNAATGNQWYNSTSGSISGATATSYSPAVSGNYYVIVTDANGCSSGISNVINFVSSGIVALTYNSSIHIYPNPCNEEFFIDVFNTNGNQEVTVEIYNTLGEQLYSEKSAGNKLKINCGSFASGLYFLNVKEGNTIHKEKIVVRK